MSRRVTLFSLSCENFYGQEFFICYRLDLICAALGDHAIPEVNSRPRNTERPCCGGDTAEMINDLVENWFFHSRMLVCCTLQVKHSNCGYL